LRELTSAIALKFDNVRVKNPDLSKKNPYNGTFYKGLRIAVDRAGVYK